MHIPFGRVISLGTVGRDVQGVKRALARAAGTNAPALGTQTFGQTAVTQLKKFQRSVGLTPDGFYGPKTHRKLEPAYDAYAFLLYTGHPPTPPTPTQLQLPSTFRATHATAGLDGYPAVDVFAPPGTVVLAPAAGQITRLSGHDPAQGGVPGGAYGWSIYLTIPSAQYFLTHFGSRTVTVGERVTRGQILGTVCDAAVAHMASSLSHIHEGKKTL